MYRRFQKSPIFFIEKTWGLTPQYTKDDPFKKGKNITWQQYQILKSVEDAMANNGKRRISIASGHGIGKSATISWLIFWFLFCYKDAQVPCTAPTADQMYDVLWKEVALWHKRMPPKMQDVFDISSSYVRINESPETWFARAKTARKENPEALAGIHADHVMMLIDEASGVPEEIFNTAEGALTNENVLVVMISNPTRLVGYFRDSHKSDKDNWQTFQFSSMDSPIVDNEFVTRIREKHGEESDEYRIRVMGQFPKEDAIDDKGFVPLLSENDLRFTRLPELGHARMGIDPAGEGKDKTVWVARDNFKAMILGKELISTSKSIAQKTLTLMTQHAIAGDNVFIDNFGEGANVAVDLSWANKKSNPINVGNKARDEQTFINLRAEGYWKLREWIKSGGELVGSAETWKQLLSIRYRRELNGKLRIMSKRDMKKAGFSSPDIADALMLTFVKPEGSQFTQVRHGY